MDIINATIDSAIAIPIMSLSFIFSLFLHRHPWLLRSILLAEVLTGPGKLDSPFLDLAHTALVGRFAVQAVLAGLFHEY